MSSPGGVSTLTSGHAGSDQVLHFSVEGTEEFYNTIQTLIDSVHPNKIEPELKKGAQIVAKEMRKRAPVRKVAGKWGREINRLRPGVLKRAIRVKSLQRWPGTPAPSIAAVDRRRAPHAWLVVHGTSGVRRVNPPRKVIFQGKFAVISHTGIMPPNRFVGDSYNAKKDEVLNKIIGAVGGMVEEAMRK